VYIARGVLGATNRSYIGYLRIYVATPACPRLTAGGLPRKSCLII
jgi:hypothetical protein